MGTESLSPGIYLEEIPSSVHPIDGVSTTTSHRLKAIAEHVRQSGGARVLFTGSGADAKLSATRALAQNLQLNLYRIELSAVVSKYIGDTEKNLRRLFDAAAASGAVLFFDEADALFGKRTAVHDSHDRYANIEGAYLLQRIEEFAGTVIVSARSKSSLDTAFLRRLRAIFSLSLRKTGPRPPLT